MSKFEIEYYYLTIKKIEIEANSNLLAIKKFREKNSKDGIKSVTYIYQGDKELTEWYCRWWNGYSWESRIVLAHDEDEIIYNVKDRLDFNVYDFHCCPNTQKEVDSLIRSLID